MMMNPNILNKNPLMFFDRAVNAQRSQLLISPPPVNIPELIRRVLFFVE